MNHLDELKSWLIKNANEKHFLFTMRGLEGLFPDLSESAYKALLSRAARKGVLIRVCRNIYLCKEAAPADGLLLYHTAALLRANEFNYVSLETILSEHGIISQVPMNWISIMSSGRSHKIDCGEFGTIEFIHTAQKAEDLVEKLHYDSRYGMWKASVAQALRDMRYSKRNCDLIDWNIANEFI